MPPRPCARQHKRWRSRQRPLAAARPAAQDQRRGVYQPFIWLMHALTLASLGLAGMLTAATGWRRLWCLPAIAAGSWLGLRVYHRLDERRFRRAVLALLLASGVTLVL